MSDILAISVPTFSDPETGRAYPNVNALGADSHRGGRKTPEYHALFHAVKNAAESAMLATGWTTAEYYVEVHWKRYVTTRRGFDPMNAMKCELDALEAAGVYANDSLVIPRPDLPQYDPTPGAIDRISLVVMRLFPPLLLASRPTRTDFVARTKRAEITLPPLAPLAKNGPKDGDVYHGGSVPQGMVVLDGRLRTMSAKDAIALALGKDAALAKSPARRQGVRHGR